MYQIIVNPAAKSGRGRKLWADLESEFLRRGLDYEVHFSKREGFVTALVRKLSEAWEAGGHAGPLKLIILGGDGTVNEALQGISDFSRVEIGYIPTGSSNDLARDLKLPKDTKKILDSILSGEKRRVMDIGEISFGDGRPSRYFAVSSGIGFDAAVCAEVLTSKLKKTLNKVRLGKLIYLMIALKQLIAAKKVAADIYLDDAIEPIHIKKLFFAAAMVHKFEGGGFKFCPGADYEDGLLDVCMVGGLSKPLLLCALPFAFGGKHYVFPHVEVYRVKRIRIKVSAPLWVHTDGEVEKKDKTVTMSCHGHRLRLLC